MKACKHLDHRVESYPTCKLVTIESMKCEDGTHPMYWERQEIPYPNAPRNVQFCGQGRGRINGIFQCYNPGEMHCYDPLDRAHDLDDAETVTVKELFTGVKG